MIRRLHVVSISLIAYISIAFSTKSCRFSKSFACEDFQKFHKRNEYLSNVMKWEGSFAVSGIAYDASSGYTYDGHPIDYETGELYGDPHLFSAPSKESIHVALLALAIDGNKHALEFFGSFERAIEIIELKLKGYNKFNEKYPGYGCWTPWVGFDSVSGEFDPLESWSTPYYKVPGLDNGEWFWALYALTLVLDNLDSKYANLAMGYRSIADCQRNSAKTIFYRGDGNVSATVYILNVTASPTPDNYIQCDGYLNDPYEGETMTQLLYLFANWTDDEEGREMLWVQKRELFQAVNYSVPSLYRESLIEKGLLSESSEEIITVQKGWWFSTHEQWKTLLLPYVSDDLPVVKKVYANAEKVRTIDAASNMIPGLMASINDVTDGSEDIPDYASACGISSVAFEEIERRDLLTPYGSFGLFLHNSSVGFCWYNNMLSGPRMQSPYGSVEAINVNGTEISPLTTWDSKITTVLAMLGGVGEIVKRGLVREPDAAHGSAYHRFVHILNKEYGKVFTDVDHVFGDDYSFAVPVNSVPMDQLDDWSLSCSS